MIDDTNTIVNVNNNKSSMISTSSTDNNNSELSGNFNSKHNNNESTIGSFITNVSVNDNYNNFICPPVPTLSNEPSKLIKKESHDD